MKKVYGVFIGLVALALLFGCADDIILEEPPPLNGAYEGMYKVTTSGNANKVFEQPIIWTFTDEEYNMRIDTTRRDEMTDHSFCSNFGEYALTDGLRLVPIRDNQPLGGEIKLPTGGNPADSVTVDFNSCTPGQSPSGLFQLQRGVEGWSLVMKQQASDTLLMEVFLTRVGNVGDTTVAK